MCNPTSTNEETSKSPSVTPDKVEGHTDHSKIMPKDTSIKIKAFYFFF